MVQSMLLEVRDAATFMPVLATCLTPGQEVSVSNGPDIVGSQEEHYLLRRCGWAWRAAIDEAAAPGPIILTVLTDPHRTSHDENDHVLTMGCATMRLAMVWIRRLWRCLEPGAVVDVEWLECRTGQPKASENPNQGRRAATWWRQQAVLAARAQHGPRGPATGQ